MPDNLSLRQATFAAEYVAKRGNGTKAALAAGYSPKGAHVSASQLLKLPKVRKKIEQLTKRHEITAERVVTRLDNLSLEAQAAGNFPAAVQAEKLLGQYLGMFVQQSVNLNVDITSQHIEAIRALSARGARRAQKYSGDAGDDALDVSSDVSTAGDNAICHKMGYTISDPDNRDKSVIDQRTTSDVLTPSTLKQSADDGSDVDGNHI